MHVTTTVFMVAVLAGALAVVMPGSAVAQQASQSKPRATAPQPETAPTGDAFMPPIRGTPDGRISGGTRGLERLPKPSDTPSWQNQQPAAGGAQGGSPQAATAPATH